MKWVMFISWLFFVTYVESKIVPRTYRDVGTPVHGEVLHSAVQTPEPLITIAGFIPLPEKIVKLGSIALLSQYVQNAMFEDVEKLAKDIVELAKVCDTDRQADLRCQKYAGYVCLDLLCDEPGLAEKYGFTECCAAMDHQRHTCFLSHKNETLGFIPPFQKPDAEEGCKQFQDHRDAVLAHFVYEVARRYPTTSFFTLLIAVNDYDDVLTTCCQEAEKEACFSAKAAVVSKQLRQSSHEQHHFCPIVKKRRSEAIFLCEFAELNQKFPKANLPILYQLAIQTQNAYVELCQGDTLQGFFIEADILKDICNFKSSISTKLDRCCGRPLVELATCIVALENDDKPVDLSSTVKWLQSDAENGSIDWAKQHFLYQYSKERPELSPEMILRQYQGYLDLLQKCCKNEELDECLSEGEKQLKDQAAETVNATCSFYDSGEGFSYQDMLLAEFTKRVPQLSFEELYKHTKQFTEGVGECCHSNYSQKLTCVERKAGNVLGDICRRHEVHPVNQQMGRCCIEPYYYRLACFNNLGADEHYVPVPFSPEFNEDLCSANPNNQRIQKQRFFVDLIKYKPTITIDQRMTVTTDLNGLLEKCCQAANHEECFKGEGPKLVERAKAVLQEH